MINGNYLNFGFNSPEELETHIKGVIKENLNEMFEVNKRNGITDFGVVWIRANDAANEILREFDLNHQEPAIKAVSSSIVQAVLETILK